MSLNRANVHCRWFSWSSYCIVVRFPHFRINTQTINPFGQSAQGPRHSAGVASCSVPARVLAHRVASFHAPATCPVVGSWEAECVFVPARLVFMRFPASDAASLRCWDCPPTSQPFRASAALVNFSASYIVRVLDVQRCGRWYTTHYVRTVYIRLDFLCAASSSSTIRLQLTFYQVPLTRLMMATRLPMITPVASAFTSGRGTLSFCCHSII